MPVAVHCPQCGKELIAPNELVGKLAACPQCNTHFPVTGGNGHNSQAGSPPASPPSSPAASHPPTSTRAPQSLAPPPPPQAIQQRMPPAEMSQPQPVDSPTAKMPDREAFFPPTKSPGTPSSTPKSPPAEPTPKEKTASAKAPTAKTASPQRAAQPARFIAAQATDTTIQLGQDGQLPTLVLQEGKAKQEVEEDAQRSNPILLAVVFGFAVVSSIALLLINPQVQRSERPDKQQARELIEDHYIKDKAHILPERYQQELRRALQAYNNEDYATERTHYRNVVRLLHAENNNALKGLTGQVRAKQHPNDEDLKDLLDILLRKD